MSMRDRARWAFAILCSMALLSAPAIWNRFPLLQYDTGGYLARPDMVMAVIGACRVLLLTNDRGPRVGILRQSRRCDRSGKNCGCGQELQVHSLSPL